MQERPVLSDRQINNELLDFVLHTPIWFWGLLLLLGLVFGAGFIAVVYLIATGVGVWGENWPVMWAFEITNFVFWVGISHAGVMISAILRLTQAEWRRPVTRAAEVLTVFALATAALHPAIHVGRFWRVFYWVFPYDFFRGIWPNVRSPLIWDPSAIFTYLTGSSLFIYSVLIPDLAVARDRSTGWRRKFYGILALGWRGNPRQWRLQTLAGILLSGLILPVFVSVHSIVSFDFAMALVPGWHSTVFAPYFVIGAVWSGVAAVATLMAILRFLFKLHNYIRPDHFDALGRLLLVVGNAWFYFFVLDFIFGLFGREDTEVTIWQARIFEWPFNVLFIIFLLTAYILPVPLLMMRSVRRSVTMMFLTSLLINIGMWLERYILIVPALQYKQVLQFSWSTYQPQLPEWGLVIGSFGLVALGVFLFAKIFPIIPIYEQKEAQVFAAEIKVGKVTVPGVIRE